MAPSNKEAIKKNKRLVLMGESQDDSQDIVRISLFQAMKVTFLFSRAATLRYLKLKTRSQWSRKSIKIKDLRSISRIQSRNPSPNKNKTNLKPMTTLKNIIIIWKRSKKEMLETRVLLVKCPKLIVQMMMKTMWNLKIRELFPHSWKICLECAPPIPWDTV